MVREVRSVVEDYDCTATLAVSQRKERRPSTRLHTACRMKRMPLVRLSEKPKRKGRKGRSSLIHVFLHQSSSRVDLSFIHFRTTMPCRRVVRALWSSSDSLLHSEPSEYPQREPPQSSLTREPPRVMPKRSQVQHDEVDETELGVLLLLLRELRDGTSEPESESESSSLLSSSESLTCAAANFAVSCSTVWCLNCSANICFVSVGFEGFGLWICEGESERPFAT